MVRGLSFRQQTDAVLYWWIELQELVVDVRCFEVLGQLELEAVALRGGEVVEVESRVFEQLVFELLEVGDDFRFVRW